MNTQTILQKVHNGERITYEEGLHLYEEAEMLDLAEAANARRQQLVPGDLVTYLIDRNINYTNVCVTDCSFCNFYALPGDDAKSYVNSKAVLGQKIEEALSLGATRILMQGGHHPDLPYEYYTDLVRWIHTTYPAIEINAFSPSEIQHMGFVSGKSWEEILGELKALGLAGLPGGGGEILDDEVRQRVSPKKIMSEDWIGVMKVAHSLGLTTTSTMVIGFRETLAQRMNHLKRLRDAQDEAQAKYGRLGFNAFISWTLQIENTPLGRSRFRDEYGSTPAEYLRHTAISRIFLDNVPHHQASWPTMGQKIAQTALHFGCDDYGSTMIEENVVSAAGAPTATKCAMNVGEMHRQIRLGGFIPAQRDSSYHILNVYDDPNYQPPVVELPPVQQGFVPVLSLDEIKIHTQGNSN
ncbi:MAG: CofH family radical SAM protein [Ardenticatenales bacterium]|nr:CofH family radical SAM protein [Ardenticatenales bacterium]